MPKCTEALLQVVEHCAPIPFPGVISLGNLLARGSGPLQCGSVGALGTLRLPVGGHPPGGGLLPSTVPSSWFPRLRIQDETSIENSVLL